MAAIGLELVGDVLITRFNGGHDGKRRVSNRGRVRGFSSRSGSRMCRYLRGCVADYRVMATLTYPGQGEEWLRCKQHLRALAERYRRAFPTESQAQGWSWFWFLEFQNRGVAHFHFFSTHPIPAAWLARAWFEVVGSGDERHLRAGTRIETLRAGRRGAIIYAKKYALKQEQKKLPALLENSGFGRWWGIFGQRQVVVAATSLGQEAFREKNIAKQFRELETVIKEGRKEEKIRRFRNPWCTIYVIRDTALEADVRSRILELNRQVIECLSGARISRIAQTLERLMPETQPGSSAAP